MVINTNYAHIIDREISFHTCKEGYERMSVHGLIQILITCNKQDDVCLKMHQVCKWINQNAFMDRMLLKLCDF